MKNLIEKTFDLAKERISNPFISSFLISFAITNYEYTLTILSSETYKYKIAFIKSGVYNSWMEAGLRFFLIPIVLSSVYLFLYPILEAWLSRLSIKIENYKQKLILAEKRKIPVDRDIQANYFKEFDAELEKQKEHLRAAIEREQRTEKKLIETQDVLNASRDRLAWLWLASHTGLTPERFKCFFDFEDWDIRENNHDILVGAKKFHLLKLLSNIISELDDIPKGENDQRIISVSWLSQFSLEGMDKHNDYVEMLRVLNIVQPSKMDENSIEITSDPFLLEKIKRNIELAKV